MQITTGTAEFESILKERLNRKKIVQVSPGRIASPKIISGDTLTTVLGKGRGGRIGEEIKDLSSKLMQTIENLDVKVETAILRKENRLFQVLKDVITQRKSLERMNFEDNKKIKEEPERKESNLKNSIEENIKRLYEFTDKNQEKKIKDLETLKIDNSFMKNEIQELKEQIKKEKKANKEMLIALSKGDGKQYFEKLDDPIQNKFYIAAKEFLKKNKYKSKTFPDYLKEVIKKQKQSKDDHFQPDEFIARFDELILFMEQKLEQTLLDYQTQIDSILVKNKELVDKIRSFSEKIELLKIWDDCVKTVQDSLNKPLQPLTKNLVELDPLKSNKNLKKIPIKLIFPDDKKKELLSAFFSRREVYELVKDKLLTPFQVLTDQSLTDRPVIGEETNDTNQNIQIPALDVKRFDITVHLNKKKVRGSKKSANPDHFSPRKYPANILGANSNVSF